MIIQPRQGLSHYRLVEKIGEGGMGVLWKAQDTRLHRHVGLKCISDDESGDRQLVDRLIMMELLEGRSLQQNQTGSPIQLHTVIDLAILIADGLDAAHDKGNIYRDIKPANIFITDRGQAKILDFGLANLATGPTREPAPNDETRVTLDMTSPGTVFVTVS